MTKPPIPYGRHWITPEDVSAVVEVLQSEWLTTGPTVERFERAFAEATGSAHAVAVSNGTAALHGIMHALGVGPGDEVLVPAMTFAASANCVVFQGATPVFVDVDPDRLLIDARSAESKITTRTRALLAVDYAGHPCDYDRLAELCERHRLALVADACHSLGATYKGRRVGTLARMTAFSLHPVKPITSAEGGMITTDDAALGEALRRFRNHGIDSDHRQRESQGSWFYEMVELGYNYRLSDLHCALGLSQLTRLSDWTRRRREIARRYDEAFAGGTAWQAVPTADWAESAHHLYVVQAGPGVSRGQAFQDLRARGIGVNVHYVPVHLHPYYRQRFGSSPGQCPNSEAAYERILSLPLFPRMSDDDVGRVIQALRAVAPG